MNDFPAIPSILVQAFPLEAYLRNLNTKLADNLNALHCSVADLKHEVKSCDTSVSQMRQFLRQQTLLELEEKIAEGGIVLPEEFSVESLLPDFLRDDQTAVGVEGTSSTGHSLGHGEGKAQTELSAMNKFLRKINRERAERTRKADDEDMKTRQKNEESQKRLEQLCEELESSQKRYMEDLERIAMWLRPFPHEDDEDETASGNRTAPRRSEAERDRYEIHEIMRTSPLFVEFRQLILRDMMDRLGEANDKQSMTLGTSIASLKEELRKEMGRIGNGGGGDGVGGGFGGEGTSGEVERRVKGFDCNYMQRGEVVATLQDKADRAVVAKKADDVYVRELEKQFLERIADLEERMTMYEAERKEFRRILRSVVDVHRRGRNAMGKDVDGDDTPTTRILPNFVVLDETTEARRARDYDYGPVDADVLHAARRSPVSRTKQRSGTVSPQPSGRQREHHDQEPQSSNGTEETAPNPRIRAVGLTANQEAYANYVTSELNRRAVEKLPPLPYEHGY